MLRWLFGPSQPDPIVTEALASQRELIVVLSEKLARETSRADRAEAESAARLEDLRKLNLAVSRMGAQAPPAATAAPPGASAIISALDDIAGAAKKREALTQDDRAPAYANTSVGGGHFYRPKPGDDRRPVADTAAAS